jgi:hypothetical protein
VLQIAQRQSSDLETDLTTLDLDDPCPTPLRRARLAGLAASSHGRPRCRTTPLRAHLTALAKLGRISDRSGFVGTAEEFADLVEELGEWGNDGVLLWGDLHPVTVHRTLDDLVPILRRRGILRRELYGRRSARRSPRLLTADPARRPPRMSGMPGPSTRQLRPFSLSQAFAMSAGDFWSCVDCTFSATSPSGVSAALTLLMTSAASDGNDELTSGTTCDARKRPFGSSR